MKVLSAREAAEWLAERSKLGSEYVRCEAGELFFSHPEASCIDIEYPPKPERLPFLARCLATIGYDAQDFRGALLWFTQWGVWNSQDEGIGYRIVEAMHSAAGQPTSFETAPGHIFRADELENAIGMLLLPMIFGWDAYYVPRWSYGTDQFFVHISHDSFASVVTRTKEFYEKAFVLLKEFDLEPERGHELQVRRFCRR